MPKHFGAYKWLPVGESDFYTAPLNVPGGQPSVFALGVFTGGDGWVLAC